MMLQRATYRWVTVLLAAASQCLLAQADKPPDHWVATWAASPQQGRVLTPPGPPRARAAQAPAASRAPALPRPILDFQNQTVRMILHTTIGGRRARVEFSNAFGAGPLAIGAAHLAIRAKDSAIVPGSDRALLFGGKPSFTIPPGALAVSDPVDLDIPAQGDLAVSVYVPGHVTEPTLHNTALQTSYVARGDATGQAAIGEPVTTQSWYWISGVDVLAPGDFAAVVAFGDSITDGTRSTPDTNRSWPSQLARRLLANPATADVAVINEGIAGNRVLRDGAGISALARFDRDVLSVPGVRWMFLMEGINDIGIGTRDTAQPADAVTADDIIAGQRQIIERAHMHGIKVIGCTLTPYEGAAYYSEKGEPIREAINRWIRTGGAFDAVVDFDKVERDPNHPNQFRADFNDGDHLHPNDAGYKAMAEAVDLSLFSNKPVWYASNTR